MNINLINIINNDFVNIVNNCNNNYEDSDGHNHSHCHEHGHGHDDCHGHGHDINSDHNICNELLKFTICYRFITTCLLLIEICDSKFEAILVKKMLIIYNLIISLKNILNYDKHMSDIYYKLKKYNKYTELLHHNLYKNNINSEYNLNMIYYYNNNDSNLEKLYIYYFNKSSFSNCFKIINNFSNDIFGKKLFYTITLAILKFYQVYIK